MAYRTNDIVEAQHYNDLVDKYNAYFSEEGGLGLVKVSAGEIVNRENWYQLWQKVKDAATSGDRTYELPQHPSAPGENPFSDVVANNYGYIITALQVWGPIGDRPIRTKISWNPVTVRGDEPLLPPPPPPPPPPPGTTFSQNYTPGTYQFTVPTDYETMTVDIAGGGGSGGGAGFTGASTGPSGIAGENSKFLEMYAYGGNGGQGTTTDANQMVVYPEGFPTGISGGATGGDQNYPKGGGAGGLGVTTYSGPTGVPLTPGMMTPIGKASDGEAGGRAVKTYTKGQAGAPVGGTVITVIVGKGGPVYGDPATNYTHFFIAGDAGGDGYAKITGTRVPPTPQPPVTIPPPEPVFFTFRAALDQVSNRTISVDYATNDIGIDGTTFAATAGEDYRPVSGTLTFAPGETYKEVKVEILQDYKSNEPDERFGLIMSNPRNVNIDVGQAIGIINGDLRIIIGPPPPPPPPPRPIEHGEWLGYYKPRPDLPGNGRFFGEQFFYWKATQDEPTPPPNTPFPYGFTQQGQYCQSDGNCLAGTAICACNGKMSYGNPYTGDPELTCFPGKRC